MPRPARTFTAESFELEGRLLLAARFPTNSTLPRPPVQFESALASAPFYGAGTPIRAVAMPIQVVAEQAGAATVTLSRTDTAGSLQVHVKSDGGFAGIAGVVVAAVDQTVTFADGQSQATLTIPIHSRPPHGEVGVVLYIKPNPLPNGSSDPRTSLLLRVVPSEPTLPPRVVFAEPTAQGLVLAFNKPMDPAGASDVNNYTVNHVAHGYDGYAKAVKIKTARYDPATQSVTLIPKRPTPNLGGFSTKLTQVHRARISVRRGHRSNVAGSLTDLQGNPINARTSPGKVTLRHDRAPLTFF